MQLLPVILKVIILMKTLSAMKSDFSKLLFGQLCHSLNSSKLTSLGFDGP